MVVADVCAVGGGEVLVAVGGVAGEEVDLVLVRVPPHAAVGLQAGAQFNRKKLELGYRLALYFLNKVNIFK